MIEMKLTPAMKFCQQRPLFVVLCGAVVIVLAKAVMQGAGMEENFISMGNDDIMRLVMVRDWLAGQSWFDTTQYRLMPPEGVLIHWSRYIDAGIAAFIVPFSYFMPMERAELIGTAIWPTVILILTLLVIGYGTKRIFGPIAACFAVMCTVLWPLLGDLHARAGNLDHHNIQLLMMVILVYAVVWPERPVAAGIIGGLLLLSRFPRVWKACFSSSRRALWSLAVACLTQGPKHGGFSWRSLLLWRWAVSFSGWA
ncbi:hypothetical protein [Yoonia algicola]|uniref:Uncharacterized protein n=1 Tax=Yoonia algicola TaxID=3137368 RepID=A0AAN0NEG3_9RHOB